jgi:hypothetical protein
MLILEQVICGPAMAAYGSLGPINKKSSSSSSHSPINYGSQKQCNTESLLIIGTVFGELHCASRNEYF